MPIKWRVDTSYFWKDKMVHKVDFSKLFCFFGFHYWGKWVRKTREMYNTYQNIKVGENYNVKYQYTLCLKCNFYKEKDIS